ncbi:hypothetical protein GCM10010124_33150 [Pilimelia terevasa]|uniref:Uncharacterized protein n=1 Tax=Pilimelia terevasa TaxID=53372 RepID=A0A8J3FL47_9ACTN|nr:hypothetical protein [Pilimelia terevasa]GGK37709.1 hypothetical protein GCM10010124_33150 [Pilimelia terevasa]
MSHDAPASGRPPEPWGGPDDADVSPGAPRPAPEDAETWDAPSDPWGGSGAPLGPWAHPPQDLPPYDPTGESYAPPAQAPPADAPAPAWPAPPPAPEPRSRGRRSFMIALAMGVLTLLAVAGWGVGIYLWGRQGAAPGQAVPTVAPTSYRPSTAAPSPADADARIAVTGQCLVNRGNEKKPDLHIAPCANADYQVLARFDGTLDYTAKCKGKIRGYEFYYFFDAAENSNDFVLCLRRRPGAGPR